MEGKLYLRDGKELLEHVKPLLKELGLESYASAQPYGVFLDLPDKIRNLRKARRLVGMVEDTVARGGGNFEEPMGYPSFPVYLHPTAELSETEMKDILKLLSGSVHSHKVPCPLFFTAFASYWSTRESDNLFGELNSVAVQVRKRHLHPDFKLILTSGTLSFEEILRANASQEDVKKAFRRLIKKTPGYQFRDVKIKLPAGYKWEVNRPLDNLGAFLLSAKTEVSFGESKRHARIVEEKLKNSPHHIRVFSDDYDAFGESWVYVQYHALPYVEWEHVVQWARDWIQDPGGYVSLRGSTELILGRSTRRALIRRGTYQVSVDLLKNEFRPSGKDVLLKENSKEGYEEALAQRMALGPSV